MTLMDINSGLASLHRNTPDLFLYISVGNGQEFPKSVRITVANRLPSLMWWWVAQRVLCLGLIQPPLAHPTPATDSSPGTRPLQDPEGSLRRQLLRLPQAPAWRHSQLVWLAAYFLPSFCWPFSRESSFNCVRSDGINSLFPYTYSDPWPLTVIESPFYPGGQSRFPLNEMMEDGASVYYMHGTGINLQQTTTAGYEAMQEIKPWAELSQPSEHLQKIIRCSRRLK